jgi:hypothetical protein
MNIADCAASVGWNAFSNSIIALCFGAIGVLLIIAYSRAGVINKNPYRPLQYAAGVAIVAAVFIGSSATSGYYVGACVP